MNHYKVGYKAVIEIDKVFEQDREKLYRANGMKSLVFDDNELNILKSLEGYTYKIGKQAAEITRLLAENAGLKEQVRLLRRQPNPKDNAEREAGQNEAWELARKIYLILLDEELEEIFGSDEPDNVIAAYSYEEAAAKVEAWEKANEEPQKTILQDFLEKYPKARMDDDGIPFNICTYNLGYEDDKYECDLKCEKCWNTPLEQI